MKATKISMMLLAAAALYSCTAKQDPKAYLAGNMPSKIAAEVNVAGVKDLHFIDIDDYDFNEMVAYRLANLGIKDGASCSEVRVGNSVVRNLDWFEYDQATYVMRVGHSDKHQASIFVCGMNDDIKHGVTELNPTSEEANHLCSTTQDGINESGVYIGVNVVPYGQMTRGEGTGDNNYTPEEGVNASKEPLMTSCLTRLILDQATDLKSAEELIKGTAWFDVPYLVKGGFQTHWLVATKEGSFVCEFVDGKPEFVYAESTDKPGYGTIMTNFSNVLAKEGIIQSHGAGYERFNTLKKNYSVLTPQELAESVFYSKMYSSDYNDPDYTWTEWVSDQFPAQQLMEWRDNAESRTGELWDAFFELYEDCQAKYDWRKFGYDYDRTRGSWFTAHSSIWDIENKTLTLDIEERGEFAARFSLADGIMK